ncbi:MAG: peptide chain release factor N(5)-glutamine methyltransferase [Deltaproteobacteria bacterium]|nr:peptide chain release factor N(5)-glutamine methyltransferase [Deltaproteobacteria bacterium]
MIWTIKALLDWSRDYFGSKGIPTPRLDAEILLAHVLSLKRIELYLKFDQPVADQELARFKELVRRRAAREPVAYLVGEVWFWSLLLAVRPGVLIPRPETEVLVEAALEALRGLAGPGPCPVVELGTGTGAIPLALCRETTGLEIVSVDCSPAALNTAAENRVRHQELLSPKGNRLWLVRGDRLEPIHPGFRPRLIVSNPPYIPAGVVESLEPEVSVHEPRLALDGGPDGLDFYRYLVGFAGRALAPGGRMVVEIGSDQADEFCGLVEQAAGLRVMEIRKDLARRPRVGVVEKAE